MGKRVIDLEEEDLRKIHLESLNEFKEIFTPVIEKYSDVHLTKKELAELWGVYDQTVTRYTELENDPLPQLKNGQFSLKESCEWLYSGRYVTQTKLGKNLFDKIKKKYLDTPSKRTLSH